MEIGSLAPVKSSNKIANNVLSIFLNIIFAVTPVVLYFLADLYSGSIEYLIVAIFYFSISVLLWWLNLFSNSDENCAGFLA